MRASLLFLTLLLAGICRSPQRLKQEILQEPFAGNVDRRGHIEHSAVKFPEQGIRVERRCLERLSGQMNEPEHHVLSGLRLERLPAQFVFEDTNEFRHGKGIFVSLCFRYDSVNLCFELGFHWASRKSRTVSQGD